MALEHVRGPRPQPGESAVVVGAGRSGLAATRLLRRLGARVRLLDRKTDALTGPQQAELYRGYMEEECRTLLSRFFQSLRAAKTENPTPSTLPPKSPPA